MIKYLGSKRLLLPAILQLVESLGDVRSVADLFSGTSRVGHALKAAGYRVTSNDLLAYAHTLATCYVQADATVHGDSARRVIAELARTPSRPGYFTETYCERARYFHPENGGKIEAIRQRIADMALEPELEAIALVSLMEAADRVDSTAGVQMAYLKQWARRATNSLELRMPALLPGLGRSYRCDALALAPHLCADLVYLDPPYNQHSYLGNYHVWETLITWDSPAVFGIANKRIDVRTRKSPFNSRRTILEAMAKLIDNVDARHIVVSFNNEGFIDQSQMIELLATRGQVCVTEIPHERYVGAKIGVYNPAGNRVGTVSHTRNLEYLFHVRCDGPPKRLFSSQLALPQAIS